MKNYKKVVSAIAALSMAASSIVMPMSASARTPVFEQIIVKDGVATILANGGVGILASYDENGRLTAIKTDTLKEEMGLLGDTITFDVKVGDKVMFWDSLDSMKPREGEDGVISAVTVTEEMMATQPPATDAPTATPEVTETPTEAPTAEPTATPTAEPTATPDAGGEEGVLQSWKFDFGSADDVAEGYTAVTADRDYMVTGDYGFLGLTEDDYKVGNRYDGFGLQEGQKITLAAGGGTGLADGIGSVGEDIYGNAGDKYYPTRFAMKVEEETYYRIKATVTTLDPTKDATASLYTERKHPIYTEKTIAAGESVTSEFTIRVTPIYYEKSEPKGIIADGMVNVAVLGENTALAALEIEQIESAPTLWVLGDSTVTDGNTTLPFWPLQTYTGVGTGLTKYLPSNVAMVNEGEGGLNAGDNYHYNMVASRIKAGDFMYVEYGHNHKNDGVVGYLNSLRKYYDKCHEVGATLVIVGPIDRHNTYDSTTNTWATSLGHFSKGGKYYVDVLRTGGTAKLDEFLSIVNASGVDAAYAWADELIAAGVTADGVTDATFVDLNQPSLDWFATLSAKGTVNDVEVTNEAKLVNYYFQTAYGSSGTDGTHPNDTGAENLAYFFFTTADLAAYPELAPLMTNFAEGATHELPTPVSPEVINLGYPANAAWPKYVPLKQYDYPVLIKDIVVEEGAVTQADVVVQLPSKVEMSGYGIIVITVKDAEGNVVGTIQAVDQVDNSTGAGPQTITNFTGDVKIEEGYTYSAMVWQALDTDSGLVIDPANVAYSTEFVPTNIETYLLPGEDGDVETFSYYGATTLTDTSSWTYGGSSGSDLTLGTDDNGVTYSTIASTGSGNSWFLMRPFENLENGTGSSGKYVVSIDLIYGSGSGLTFNLAKTTMKSSPFAEDMLAIFTVGNDGVVTAGGQEVGTLSPIDWTNVKYIIDMDYGKAEISVAGGTPVEIDLPDYQSTSVPPIDTFKHLVLSGARTTAFDVKASNLVVGKLKADVLPEKTLTVSVNDPEMGTAVIVGGETSVTAPMNTIVTLEATPVEGYEFVQWVDADGNNVGYTPVLDVRMHDSLAVVAEFKAAEYDPITYTYKEDFSKLATSTLSANGWTSTNAQGSLTVEADSDHGNYLQFAPGSANSRGMQTNFATGLTSNYILEADIALTAGTNQETVFAITNAAQSNSINNNADNYVFSLLGAAYATSWTINGGTEAVEIPAGTWVHLKLSVGTDENVGVEITNGDTVLYSGTVTAVGGIDLKGIHLRSGRYNAVTKIDNIRVYTADQVVSE